MNVLFQFYEFEKGKLTIDGHDVKRDAETSNS